MGVGVGVSVVEPMAWMLGGSVEAFGRWMGGCGCGGSRLC